MTSHTEQSVEHAHQIVCAAAGRLVLWITSRGRGMTRRSLTEVAAMLREAADTIEGIGQ